MKRHDHVVKTLAGSFLKGTKGGWAVEFNAGTGEDGSTHAMLHEGFVQCARPQNRDGERNGQRDARATATETRFDDL